MAGYGMNFTFTFAILGACNPALKFNIHPVLGSWLHPEINYTVNVSEQHAASIFQLTTTINPTTVASLTINHHESLKPLT
jgi:hypothetical protein